MVLFESHNAHIVLGLLINHLGVDDVCEAKKGEQHF